MGTGSFVSYNTAEKPHASVSGLYPVVGWKIGDEVVFIAEGHSSDTATVIEWCRDIDLFEEYDNSFKIQINYLDIIKSGYFKNKKKLNLKI